MSLQGGRTRAQARTWTETQSPDQMEDAFSEEWRSAAEETRFHWIRNNTEERWDLPSRLDPPLTF